MLVDTVIDYSKAIAMVEQFEIVFLLFLITLMAILILIVNPRAERKRTRRLVEHYNGKLSWPLGELILSSEGVLFRIKRMARGGGMFGSGGGSYPLLWSYVEPCPKIIIGHAESGRFTRGAFLRLPPTEELILEKSRVLVGSDDPAVINSTKPFAHDAAFSASCAFLFDREFSHLTFSSEIHFFGIIPRKFFVMHYTCLP